MSSAPATSQPDARVDGAHDAAGGIDGRKQSRGSSPKASPRSAKRDKPKNTAKHEQVHVDVTLHAELANDGDLRMRAAASVQTPFVRGVAVEAQPSGTSTTSHLSPPPHAPHYAPDAVDETSSFHTATRATLERPGGDDGGVFDVARELLSSEYYFRQWGRLGMRNRSEIIDDFGHDVTYDARLRPWLELLYRNYFRAVAEGIENIPAQGSALIVANHSGTLPYDSVMLKTAVRLEHPSRRDLRWLAEDFVFYLPFVGSFINRIGAVRACPENAERLLQQERLVAVFPEGAKGTGRLFRERYRLQRFGRGGFVRLCLRTRTPIIPCAIVGAEESMPMLHRLEYLTNLLGVPYIPITPTFPLLGPVGLIPAPTKWSFLFGDPIHLDGYAPDAESDDVLVGRLAERVRATIQGMLDRAIAARRSVWFG